MFSFIKKILKWYKDKRAFKKRLEALRKRDPFIYK